MEPPSKRMRLDLSSYGAHDDSDDEENQDELSMTPAQFDAIQDPMYQLDKGRAKAATKLKSTFEDIFAKYGKDFEGDDDVINFYTDEIEIDNGHVQSLENRNDDTVETSLSGDEENRIPNGKPGTRKKQSRSKSLVPVNNAAYNQRPQVESPWDDPPGPSPYQLSSLSFPSPSYGSHPPFEFGHSPFGNIPVDPVWQAPALPIQPPQLYNRSFLGGSGDRFGSFGGLGQTAGRRVSAKSFLLHTTSSFSKASNASTEEEDDVLVSKDKQTKLSDTQSEDPKEVPVTETPMVSSQSPIESSNQQAPLHGNGPAKDKPPNKLGPSAGNIAPITEPPTMEATLLPPQLAQDKKRVQRVGSSRPNTSPSRRKRGPRKKNDTGKPGTVIDEEAETVPRSLQSNERKIEIRFPMTKHRLPPEAGKEQDAQDPTLAIGEISQLLATQGVVPVDENTETVQSEDSTHTSHSMDGYEDATIHQPLIGLADHSQDVLLERPAMAEDLEAASEPRAPQEPRRRRPKRARESGTFLAADNLSGDGNTSSTTMSQSSKNIEIPQLAMRKMISDAAEDTSPTVDLVEGQEAHTESLDGVIESVKTILLDKRIPELSPIRSMEKTRDDVTGNTTHRITEIRDPTAPETPIPEIAIPQGLEDLHDADEDVLQNDPYPPPPKFHQEAFPKPARTSDNTPTPSRDIQLEDVFIDSESSVAFKATMSTSTQRTRSRRSKQSVMHRATKSNSYLSEDPVSPAPKEKGLRENQGHATYSQSPSASGLIAEVDSLQLDSDNRNIRLSSSPEVPELPDQDLSAFPISFDAEPEPDLTPSPSLSTMQSDTQDDTCIGRSPSPELGTPVGDRIARQVTSPSKRSPDPTTPTKRQVSRGRNPRSSRHRSPSSKRFPLSSLIPGGIDDESDDELSVAGSFSSTGSRVFSPFAHANISGSPSLPPMLFTPRRKTGKYSSFLTSSPSKRTPKHAHGPGHTTNTPPATESRAGRKQGRRGQGRGVHSSPLARTVAERLLSSPTKRQRTVLTNSPGLVASPHGTLRRCGEDGFACQRAFCLTCCN